MLLELCQSKLSVYSLSLTAILGVRNSYVWTVLSATLISLDGIKKFEKVDDELS